MIRKKNLPFFILSGFLTFLSFHVAGQEELNKEVKVVKPYEPVITDAFKQHEMPEIIDTTEVNPQFTYKVKPYSIEIDYNVEPIKAAKLIGEPLKKLYGTYLSIGFGNYLTPAFKILHNSKYSTKHTYSISGSHHSSSGKIRNTLDRRVFAGYSENKLGLSGAKFLKNKTLHGALNYDNSSFFYYGYNPDKVYSLLPPGFKDDMDKQMINLLKARAGIKSNHLDSTHVNYDLLLAYNFMQEINKINEQHIDLTVNLNYFFENEFTGIDSRIITYNRSLSNSGLESNPLVDQQVSDVNTLVEFNPWIGAFGPKWQIVVGVNTSYELENARYHFYPRLSLHYNVIDYFLIPYFEYSGKIHINDLTSLLIENPYFLFPVNLQTTNYRSILSAGVRGNFSPDISFNFRMNYSDIKDQYFYVNDTSTFRENQFTVVFDDVKQMELMGEVSYKKTERLNFHLHAQYFQYQLSNIEEAWHRPGYKVSFNTRYNIKSKILFDLSAFAIGNRYARIYKPVAKTEKLDDIFDINVGAEYRYSKILSGFIRLNNLLGSDYSYWNYYPSQRFNFILGVTYSF